MVIAQENIVNTDRWPVNPHVKNLEASILREILKTSSQPGVISFAGGLPAPEMFPLVDLQQALTTASATLTVHATQSTVTVMVKVHQRMTPHLHGQMPRQRTVVSVTAAPMVTTVERVQRFQLHMMYTLTALCSITIVMLVTTQ